MTAGARRLVAAITVGATAGGVLVGVTARGSSNVENRATETSSSTTTATTPTPDPPPAPDGDAIAVRTVIDGDTLTLADGRTIRLAQVDAPERGACFSSESTAALRGLVAGERVTLRRPSDAPARDKFGRTVAELYVGGVSVDEALIRDGAAEWYEQFAHEDADLAARLNVAEQQARAAGRGLWSVCKDGSRPSTAPPSTSPVRAFAAPAGNCHPAYPGTCIPPPPPDLDCGSIGRKVQVDHAHGDPHRLDADGDGWGCESYG